MTGAIRPDKSVSITRPAKASKPPPNCFRLRRLCHQQNVGEQLGHDQQSHRADEHPGRENRILRRPLRKQGKSLREILGPDELSLQRDQDSEHQEQQPQRRREIRTDPREQMKPRNPMQAASGQHRQMLQVALAPSPVARGEIQ